MVRLLLDAAVVHRERGDVKNAEELLSEALRVSEDQKKTQLIAAVRASQGVLERARGDYDAAGKHLQEAVQLRRSLSDDYGVARALSDLGRVHLDAGRPNDAAPLIEEAVGISGPFDPGRTRAEVLENAGLLHARLGGVDRARTILEQASKIYEQLGDRLALARVGMELGKLQPGGNGGQHNLDEELGELERSRLLAALEAEGWNQSRAARRLGVTETRVRNLMRRHGLRPRNRRGRPRKVGEPLST